jgi:hypothetical protein
MAAGLDNKLPGLIVFPQQSQNFLAHRQVIGPHHQEVGSLCRIALERLCKEDFDLFPVFRRGNLGGRRRG